MFHQFVRVDSVCLSGRVEDPLLWLNKFPVCLSLVLLHLVERTQVGRLVLLMVVGDGRWEVDQTVVQWFELGLGKRFRRTTPNDE